MADLSPTTVSPRLIYDNYLATSKLFEEYNSPQILVLPLRCTYGVKENTSVDSRHENYSDSI
jgi:hypothetical protein